MTAHLLATAVRELAARCDGAAALDGHGFNKLDAHFGRKLATEPPDRWTPRQCRAAWQMLRKYRGQLSRYGVDYAAIPEPPKLSPNEARPERLVSLDPGGNFVLEFPYDGGMLYALKQARVGARFQRTGAPRWIVPANRKVLDGLVPFLVAYDMEFADKVQAVIDTLADQRTATVQLSGATSAPRELAVPGFRLPLRPFQQAGALYATTLPGGPRCILGDRMGLGKTPQALAILALTGAWPAVAVVPASLCLTWQAQARKFLGPDFPVAILNGVKDRTRLPDEARRASLVIVAYDGLIDVGGKTSRKGWGEALARHGFRGAIYDECHYAKSYKAKRTEACKALSLSILTRCGPAAVLLGLSGTMFLNRPQEGLSQLMLIDRLKDLGGFWSYAHRYCDAHKTRWGWDLTGAQHLDELNERLRATCYVRREIKDVLPELPAIEHARVVLPIDNRAEYDRAEADVCAYLADEAKRDAAFLDSITALSDAEQRAAKDARANEASERARRAEHLVRIETLKQLAAHGKLAAAQQWVETFLESGEKLLAFAHHRVILSALGEANPGAAVDDGEASHRQALVDRLNDDPACRLGVLPLQGGGVGLSVSATSHVALLEFGWRPLDHDQPIGRVVGIDRGKDGVPPVAWYLVAEGTIDEWILDLIDAKRTVVDAATEGAGGSILNDVIARLVERAGKGGR